MRERVNVCLIIDSINQKPHFYREIESIVNQGHRIELVLVDERESSGSKNKTAKMSPHRRRLGSLLREC